MIDLWQGHRNKFIKCEYWSQVKDKNVGKFSELIYERQPNGFFKASIIGSYQEESKVLENSWMYKKVNVVIETKDNVKELERNDLVRMKGELYRVKDISRNPITKQEQYLKDPISYTTIISLTR